MESKKIDKLDYSMGLFVIYFGTKKFIKILPTIQYGWERGTKAFSMIFLTIKF